MGATDAAIIAAGKVGLGTILKASLVGGAVDGILSFIGGWGEEEIAKADRKSKEKIAADLLGFNYAELEQQRRQFDKELRLKANQFAQEMGFNLKELRERARQFNSQLGLETDKAETQKSFGLSDRYAQMAQQSEQKKRRAGIRNAFAGKRPAGRPTMAAQSTAQAPGADMGSQLLLDQQKTPTPTNKIFPIQGI